MTKIVTRRSLKVQKTHAKSKNDAGYYPVHQTIATTGLPELFKVPITSASFTSNAFKNGSTIYYDIEPHELKSVECFELKLKLSASGGDVELAPSFYMFQEIELIGNKGSGQKIGDYVYPETSLMWNAFTLKDDELKYAGRHQNYHLHEIKSESKYRLCKDDYNIIRDGDTKYIYVKIPFNFVHFDALDFSHISTPTRIRLKCSSDCVVSGDVNNLSLDDIHIVALSRREEPFDNNHRLALNKRKNKYIFLETEKISYNNKQITAGTTVKMDMQSAIGKCPFIVAVIKPNTTPVASDESLYDFVELGPNATIDLQNSSGQSEIAASNNNWDIEYLEKYYHQNTGSKGIKGVYVLPFCENIHKSIAGQINGFYQFYGQRCDVCFTPDVAGTAEVQNVDTGVTAPDGGSYAFQVDSEVSDYLSHDATVTEMKTAFEAMKCVKNLGLTATFDSTAATGSFNITFDANRDGRVSDRLGIVKIIGNNLNDGDVIAKPSSSVTTYGKLGWNSSSNYTVDLFVYKFVELCVDKNGKLSCKDL